MRKYVMLAGFLLIVFLAGILTIQDNIEDAFASEAPSVLPVVGSIDKLKSLLKEMDQSDLIAEDVRESAAPAPAAGATRQESKAGAGQDYSRTNLQVQGVDEADIVKTDGKYIYQVSNGKIVISQAYPASAMKPVKVFKFSQGSFNPQELYVDASFLAVIGTTSDTLYDYQVKPAPGVDIFPPPYPYRQFTKAIIYDIKDKNHIKQVRTLELSGTYVSSRKIGPALYLVTNKNIDRYRIMEQGQIDLPIYRDSVAGNKATEIGLDEIRYFPDCSTPNYMLVAGLDLSKPGKKANVSSFLGSGENIYVSPSALYAAVSRYERPRPLVQRMPGIWPQPLPLKANTTIYKFTLNTGNVAYKASGKVPGTVLNQFSMDAHNGYLRVATTSGDMWRSDENTSKNNVYVLDGNLKITGQLENIAPGERIYSARFVGDRAYLVTFKNVDPFFVIDMKNPAAPKVLGALKIPGYSNYLHPVDANHVLGFGKDTAEEKSTGWNGQQTSIAYYQGMKMALFDVSNVSRPVEKFKTVIGHRGTESPLLYDHRALLFDKAKGLLAFPVTVMEVTTDSSTVSSYGEFVFQGAYVYSFSIERGFSLLGKITHLDDQDILKSGYGWYGSDKNIERVLYIGDTLYTVSRSKIKANDMKTLEDVGSLNIAP